MKLLLDENLPKRLKEDFTDHEVFTVRDLGWNGKKDTELLTLLKNNGFDALLTFDKNIRYQQNFTKTEIAVFIFSASINSYKELTKLSPIVRKILDSSSFTTGPVVIQI